MRNYYYFIIIIKHSAISTNHSFIPVAVDTMGPINHEGSAFLDELGNRIAEISEDPRSHIFPSRN